jgi:cobaltochelatase CobT
VLDDPEEFARQSLQLIACVIPSEDDPPTAPTSGASSEQHDGPSSVPAGAMESDGDARGPSSASSAGALQSEGVSRTPPVASNDRPELTAPAYGAYTRRFDRVSLASDLRDSATLERRRRELDRHKGIRRSGVARWAHRLQRRLLALQVRSWSFDRDEGVLDAARLTRVVTHPLEPLAYKQESEIEFPDTVVSLLVDNSGSMRGASIANAAACAEILGRVLERCGVKTEILGFTTRSWQGGHARCQWVADGRPPRPGRVADLQHVIYKSADEPWRRARMQLGLMLEDDLLKENIDGEALQWAAERLQRRAEPRRILIVISDGAPLDEATLAANDAGYLDRHLRTVIRRLERGSPLEVLAIGIGHDVTKYYRRAVELGSAEEMGEALVAQLTELLASKRQLRRLSGMQSIPKSHVTLERGESR